jgi:hypothetical protein
MKRRTYCFIAICVPPKSKQATKATLALTPGVFRVTDHGAHIKVNATRRRLPAIAGMHALRVRDRTRHFDAAYWDFAMAAFRHATKKRHAKEQAMGVMFHYLANLFGIPEPEWCEREAAGRRYLNAAYTDEEAHGWEFPHVERLKRMVAKAAP